MHIKFMLEYNAEPTGPWKTTLLVTCDQAQWHTA